MILQEKIQKKAERFGKLAPAFLEGAKFALENQWVNINEDLPYNHKELLVNDTLTKSVIIRNSDGSIEFSLMYLDVEWKWMSGDNPTHWLLIPELSKE